MLATVPVRIMRILSKLYHSRVYLRITRESNPFSFFSFKNIFVLKFFLYVFPFHESCLRQLNETKTILVTSVIYNAREMQNAYQIWTELAYDVFDHELFVLNSQVIRQPATIETN